MNRGIMFKAAIELWPSTVFCGLLLFGTEAALAYVIPTFQGQLSDSLLKIKFLQDFLGAMLGVEITDQLGPEAFLAFPWVHPVVLTTVWAHALLCCTRVPAGEIDRGTADVTMTLPVTRWGLLASETVVWMVAGIVVLLIGLGGNLFGGQFVAPDDRPNAWSMFIIQVNLYALYLAVGAVAWFASTVCDRRGVAMSGVFVVLLASFLVNFLAQFWDVAERIAFLGLLHYYRPIFVLRDDLVPWRDLGVLAAVAAGMWMLAGVVFSRRDICTT